MNKIEMDELLSMYISKYGGMRGKSGAYSVAKKLKMESVMDEIFLGENAFQAILNALIKSGKILETNIEEKQACAVIAAGTANMNPAIVVIKTEENGKVSIIATAKEGLIKQHTAEKAIKLLKAQL